MTAARRAPRCRRCHAPVLWAIDEQSGRPVMLNPCPSPVGMVYVARARNGEVPPVPVAQVASELARVSPAPERFALHGSTCSVVRAERDR
jgi:hypothetical protein